MVRLYLLLGLWLAHAATWHPPWFNPPSSADLVVQNGYPVQKHEIATEDGYLLTVFRVPFGKKSREVKGRPPVLVQHGLMCSSDCWVLPIPEKGLPYLLADAGYDVWIGNSRGNDYSRKHKTRQPANADFWEFSVHEMGYYDLPAMIDYILNATGAAQLSYIGHSQGTTEFFIMASTRPEYNAKLKAMFALAPVAYLENAKGLAAFVGRHMNLLGKLATFLNVHHLFDHAYFESVLDHNFCREHSIFQPICQDIIFVITGFDSPQLNQTLMRSIGDYCPTGASIRQLEHFGQLITNGGKFTFFDYGMIGNVLNYHSMSAPEYDLTAITTPVYLHYSEGDFLARPPDVLKLSKQLPNATLYKIAYQDFNHVDYMWATDVKPLLYDIVLTKLKSYH